MSFIRDDDTPGAVAVMLLVIAILAVLAAWCHGRAQAATRYNSEFDAATRPVLGGGIPRGRGLLPLAGESKVPWWLSPSLREPSPAATTRSAGRALRRQSKADQAARRDGRPTESSTVSRVGDRWTESRRRDDATVPNALAEAPQRSAIRAERLEGRSWFRLAQSRHALPVRASLLRNVSLQAWRSARLPNLRDGAATEASPQQRRRTAQLPGPSAHVTLPDLQLTPGLARSLTVEQICSIRWGRDRRFVTLKMRQEVFRAYGIPWTKHRLYEVDHLIPRELGGADDVRNLWPQPWPEAHEKDRDENAAHHLVCNEMMTLDEAQRALVQWGREPTP